MLLHWQPQEFLLSCITSFNVMFEFTLSGWLYHIDKHDSSLVNHTNLTCQKTIGPLSTEGLWKHLNHHRQLQCKLFRGFCMYAKTHILCHEDENTLTLTHAHTGGCLCFTSHQTWSRDKLRLSYESPLYHSQCTSIRLSVMSGEKQSLIQQNRWIKKRREALHF